jgi:hypothetical protein
METNQENRVDRIHESAVARSLFRYPVMEIEGNREMDSCFRRNGEQGQKP